MARSRHVAALGLGALALVLLLAAGRPIAQAIGDEALARPVPVPLLAAACANCHGTDGIGAWPISSIAGRPYQELRRQLLAFRDGEAVEQPTVMDRLMKGYSDQDIEALAKHFSALHVASE